MGVLIFIWNNVVFCSVVFLNTMGITPKQKGGEVAMHAEKEE